MVSRGERERDQKHKSEVTVHKLGESLNTSLRNRNKPKKFVINLVSNYGDLKKINGIGPTLLIYEFSNFLAKYEIPQLNLITIIS